MKLSRGRSVWFRHNDIEDLSHQLEKVSHTTGTPPPSVFIAVESVYSMDGHFAPLAEICAMAKKFGAYVVLDEAHGTGVVGPEGRGLAGELELEEQIFCRVYTFGKAL